MPTEPQSEPGSVEEQLFDAARNGDTERLGTLLDENPEKLRVRARPYSWTLLHLAAAHLATVKLLLDRGLDVNAREKGDNTYAMHWAAAAGKLDVVRLLADSGGDVVGHGDDHELEVLGWATCWDGCDDEAHRAVADFLVNRGARHHIFSAIAMNRPEEVRRIVSEDPSAINRRMSRNEDQQLPLHFAVRMRRPAMVSLLLELGADPLGVDGSGYAASAYATGPDMDLPIMHAIRALTFAELVSAERGNRRPKIRAIDIVAALALADWGTATRLWNESAAATEPGAARAGVLHLMSKRGDTRAVEWLLDLGAEPNERWPHWDAEVTPLHLAVLAGHTDVARLLLARGGDPSVRDTKHDSDAIGWAGFFGRDEIATLCRSAVRS